MELRLDKYIIRTDSTSYTLLVEKTITAKEGGKKGREAKAENIGKTREQVLGYYGKFRQVLKAMVEYEIRDSNAKLVKHLNKRLDKIEAMIDEIPDWLYKECPDGPNEKEGTDDASADQESAGDA